MSRHHLLLSAMVSAVILSPPSTSASGPSTAIDVPSKIDKVMVYSRFARVHRRAKVVLKGGATRVRLAALPLTARRETVRVESRTARVRRVELKHGRGVLIRQKRAKALLARIEALVAKQRQLYDERQILGAERNFIDELELQPATRRDKRRPLLGIFVGAWRQILGWIGGRNRQLRARVATINQALLGLDKQLHAMRVEAKDLRIDRADQSNWYVIATFEGHGKHQVELSYLVSGAQWRPSYDLRYDSARRRVKADYYALVRQSSGEDWQGARLRFATTTPTDLLAVPELPTWTMGRKRDFIPKPRPRYEPAPRSWRARTVTAAVNPTVIRLRAALGMMGQGRTIASGRSSGQGGLRRANRRRRPYRARPRKIKRSARRFDSDDISGALARPSAAKSPPPPSAPPSPSPALEAVADRAPQTSSVSRRGWRGSRRRVIPTSRMPWTDVGYRPPVIPADLPAAAAKGYRYVLFAPGQHRIDSDGRDRRIPLFGRQLKVTPVHRIVPGRSKSAYLMGTLKNTTGRPILRGSVNLFSGKMFSGRSWLNTALPGKELKLPLGVDDYVKVERQLKQKTISQGLVFKDDVTEYTVQIEVGNNHRYPIEVELIDQVPKKRGEKIEIRSFSSTSGLKKTDIQGRVRWHGTIKGHAVKKLAFSFQIVRPKDWELRQHGY